MRRTMVRTGVGFMLVMTVSTAWASERWLHIRVEEKGDTAESVHVNLPFSLLGSVIPLIHDSQMKDGKLKLGEKEFDAVQLRALWDAVRSSADSEYVTVKSAGQMVRVAKSGESLVVKVSGSEKQAERVNVNLPLAVVDALLSGPPDELNLAAALRALGDQGNCELVTVNEDSSTVRVWVDGQNESR